MPFRHLLPIACAIVLAAPAPAAAHSLAEPDAATPTRLGDGWLSSDANDFNLSLDAAGRLLVFGRSSSADFSDAQVWIARRDSDRWLDPQRASFSDPRWRHSDPWLTPDGRWLYFVSSRPAPGRDPGREDLDLWRAPVEGQRIGKPEHLAGASSPGEELGPEVHDGWLVFNSTRTGGPAPMSLYRARLVDGLPGTPEPMPAPFNDGRVQGDLTFSPDGRVALFWSVRGDSTDPDLFVVRRDRDGWSAAERLPPPLNAPGMDFTPAFSADGRVLRWASQRAPTGSTQGADGRADLYAIRADVLASGAPSAEQVPTREHLAPRGMERSYHEWHYSPVVKVGEMVIVSGIPAGHGDTYEDKVRNMFRALERHLATAGATLGDVVELTSFHAEAQGSEAFGKEFERFAPIHHEFFPTHYPAWTAVGTTALLMPGAPVELRAVAVIGSGKRPRLSIPAPGQATSGSQ